MQIIAFIEPHAIQMMAVIAAAIRSPVRVWNLFFPFVNFLINVNLPILFARYKIPAMVSKNKTIISNAHRLMITSLSF